MIINPQYSNSRIFRVATAQALARVMTMICPYDIDAQQLHRNQEFGFQMRLLAELQNHLLEIYGVESNSKIQ